MKKVIIIFLVLITNQVLWGQKLKYEEIIEIIKKKDYDIGYSLLFDYQRNAPEFANTYFQLGNISYYWMLNTPINDFNQKEYHIKNTKLFFGLCLSKLEAEPRDVKKNKELYKTIPEFENIEKIDNEIVVNYINTKLKETELHHKNAKKTYNAFYNLVDKYNKTVDNFLAIIENYDKLKDVYLEEKSSILKSTNELIVNFDSSLFFYDEYKLSLKNQKLKSYNVELELRDIKTYRLEGITRTNFLKDTIKLWDYKTWAYNVQDNLSKNISHFRETITRTNKELTDKEKELINSKKYSNSFKNYEIDQTVFFEIEKYDYNSILTELFQYKKAKVDYLVQQKRVFNDTSNYSTNPTNRAIGYYELIKLKTKADTLLEEFEKVVNEQEYMKHKEFFNYNYKGYDGLVKYIKNEKSNLNKLFKSDLYNISYLTSRDVFHINHRNQKVIYKEKEIPLIVSTKEPSLAEPDKYYTLSIDENKSGEKYITGYYKTTTGTSAFIAKIVNNNVEWLNEGKITNKFEYGTTVKTTADGCIVIIRSIKNNKQLNSIVKISSSNKQIYKKDLKTNKFPRFFEYDEINEEVIIALQGEKIDNFNQTNDSIYFQKINIDKNEILWSQDFLFDANIINVIKMDKTYQLIANYHRISIGQENFLNSKSNIIIMNFSTDGKYQNSKELMPNNFVWGTFAYKINSQTINIVGYTNKINPYSVNIKKIPTTYYLILDKENNIIYQNY